MASPRTGERAGLFRKGFWKTKILFCFTATAGLILLLGHNVWAWDWPVFVTIAGRGMAAKATIDLLFPAVPDRMIVNADR